MASAYDRILVKYEWSEEHVNKFKSAVAEFWKSNECSVRREDDLERGEATFYVNSVPSVPDHISLILGDAIHNLRSTLDHLAWAVVMACGGTVDEHAYFPIANAAKDFESVLCSRIKCPGHYCLEEFRRIQPYRDGFGHWAWQLHQLDITDKHKLILTVATIPIHRTLTPHDKAPLGSRFKPSIFVIGAFQQMLGARAPSIALPLEAGHKLDTLPISELSEDVRFAFDIAINEVDIVGCVPASVFLDFFADEVLKAVNELSRFL